MGRLRRFDRHRYVGTRDTMLVYDTDDDVELAILEARTTADHLLERDLLQGFAPDTTAEAENRGFLPVSVIRSSG